MTTRPAEDILEELLAWTKFAHRSELISAVRSTMSDPKHLLAYEATDGSNSQSDVAKSSGLSQPAISALWAKWSRLGLVTNVGARPAHLARPSDLGLL